MIQPIGYVKLHRELASKPIWLKSTAEQKVILITLLMMANFKSNQWEWSGEKFEVLPGQFVTSLDSIAKECGTGISIQNVRTALVRFEKLDFLTNESTKNGRLITIANWSLYQDANKEPNIVDNKDLTKTSQRPNKDLTPKEESNKEIMKEGKKENNSRFTPPTLEEVKTYCLERNNGVDPNKWINFYESKGWMVGKNKMSNWKAAVRTWEDKNKNTNKLNGSYGDSKTDWGF